MAFAFYSHLTHVCSCFVLLLGLHNLHDEVFEGVLSAFAGFLRQFALLYSQPSEGYLLGYLSFEHFTAVWV